MARYNLLTLNAYKMLASETCKIMQTDNTNWKVLFQFDLSEQNPGDHDVIFYEKAHEDNALFYQIRQCLDNLTEKSSTEKDLLRQVLIFIDFKEVFQKSIVNTSTFDDYYSKTENDLKGDEGLGYRLRWMFNPDNGINISFDGNTWKTFVPFDKSGNMARSSFISFIDKDMKDKIDRRLLLDIDFSRIPVISSKFYAYRGLYLSSGYRIEQSSDPRTGLCLNEETVIVIPDKMNKVFGDVFTANKSKDDKMREDVPWSFSIKNFSNKLTTFDGEGLICPQYASFINKKLKENYRFKTEAHSFQTRMPFTKGVLHEVDFNKFFTEQLATLGKPLPDELLTEDIFHIKRDLRKAKIILTESMFKCCGWLAKQTDIWKNEMPEVFHDPMKYYFEKMDFYKHTLYITNTDTRLSSSGIVPLNYQFLSTLSISPAVFTSLIEDHIERLNNLPNSFAQKKAAVLQSLNELDSFDVESNTEDEEPAVEENLVNIREKCLKALSLNTGFLKEPKIKSILEDIKRGFEEALCIGRLEVSGEQRFLSCDLLELLRYMYSRITNVQMSQEQLKQLRRQRLYSDHFYMPEKKLKMKADKYYGFLRNPHLARNEQCILRPYVKTGSLHDKYFSHLTGVVMLSCESLVPMALGGADFDGDLAKIVSDKRIVDAIAKGGYEMEGKRLIKSLPVIKIPSLKSSSETDLGTIPYKTIKNTFSNQIGQISNKAIKIARIEYGTGDPRKQEIDETKGKCCAGCTIVTGLEIDAAKTGVHPKANISAILFGFKKKENEEKEPDIFLEPKKSLDTDSSYNRNLRPYIIKEDSNNNNEPEKFSMYLTPYGKEPWQKQKPSINNIPVFTKEYAEYNNVFNLDRLPGEYLKHLQILQDAKTNNNKADETVMTTQKQKTILFKFQRDEKWRTRLDKDKKEALQKLILAYTKIKTLIRWTKEEQNKAEKSNYLGYINTLLKVQYDCLEQKLPCGIKVCEARNQAYATVRSAMDNSTDTMKAVERLKNEKWQYTVPELRQHKINIILGNEENRAGQLLPSVTELLSNFRNGGYMILFYILKDVESTLDKNIDPETFILKEELKKELKQAVQNGTDSDTSKRKKQKADFTAPEDNPYYEELYKTYSSCNARKQEGWHLEIAEKCREHMEKLFNGDMDMALQYVVATSNAGRDTQHNFLWNTFTSNEILRNVNEL